MSPRKKKIKNKSKAFVLELSLGSLIVWSFGCVLLLVWIFVLGVLVGRGYLSFGLMKDKIAEVQKMVGKDDSSGIEPEKQPVEDPKFAFYEELSTKKEEAARKNRPTAGTKISSKKPEKKVRKKPETRKEHVETVQQYVLQIGSFGAKAKAIALVKRIKKHYPVFLSKAKVNGKFYYRVNCGPFATEKKADEFKKVLSKNEKIHGFVTRAGK